MNARFPFLFACLVLPLAAADPPPFAAASFQLELPRCAASTVYDRRQIDYGALSTKDRLRLEQLKPGITRREVLKHFDADGGLISPMAERYYLRDTRLPSKKVAMVDIAFKPAAMDEATYSDPQKRTAWFRSHDWGDPNDIVKEVGIPYESFIAID